MDSRTEHYPIFTPAQPSPRYRLELLLRRVAAVAGWALFVYWWWLVSGDTDSRTVARVTTRLSLIIAAIPLTAAAWILHNLKLARRGRRGNISSYRAPLFEHDSLGRPLLLHEATRAAQDVGVTVEHYAKIYASAAPPEKRSAAAAGFAPALTLARTAGPPEVGLRHRSRRKGRH